MPHRGWLQIDRWFRRGDLEQSSSLPPTHPAVLSTVVLVNYAESIQGREAHGKEHIIALLEKPEKAPPSLPFYLENLNNLQSDS